MRSYVLTGWSGRIAGGTCSTRVQRLHLPSAPLFGRVRTMLSRILLSLKVLQYTVALCRMQAQGFSKETC